LTTSSTKKGVAHGGVAHAAAGGVFHLGVLQVEARIGKLVDVAGMVVVQMGQHHVGDGGRRHAQHFQRLDGAAHDAAAAQRAGGGAEAGVHQD